MTLLELLVLVLVIFFFIVTILSIVVDVGRKVLGYIADFREKISEEDLYR